MSYDSLPTPPPPPPAHRRRAAEPLPHLRISHASRFHISRVEMRKSELHFVDWWPPAIATSGKFLDECASCTARDRFYVFAFDNGMACYEVIARRAPRASGVEDAEYLLELREWKWQPPDDVLLEAFASGA